MTGSASLYRIYIKPAVLVRAGPDETCYTLDPASASFVVDTEALIDLLTPGADVDRETLPAFAMTMARFLAQAPGDPLGLRVSLDAFRAREDEVYLRQEPMSPEDRAQNRAIANEVLQRVLARDHGGLPPEIAAQIA